MHDIKSGYLPSIDMFILLIVNKHRIAHISNMQHSKSSNEYIPEASSVITDESSSSQWKHWI